RLRRWIRHIVEPSLDRHLARRFRQIPESHKVRVNRRVGPGNIAQFVGRAGLRLRIETRADQIQNSAESQIITHHLREQGSMRLGWVRPWREVGYRHAWLLDAQARSSPEPVLLLRYGRNCGDE